jgi:hypothetical protein
MHHAMKFFRIEEIFCRTKPTRNSCIISISFVRDGSSKCFDDGIGGLRADGALSAFERSLAVTHPTSRGELNDFCRTKPTRISFEVSMCWKCIDNIRRDLYACIKGKGLPGACLEFYANLLGAPFGLTGAGVIRRKMTRKFLRTRQNLNAPSTIPRQD